MPNIKLNLKMQSMIRKLGSRGSILQVVAAETVNESAEDLQKKYARRLKRKQRLRNKRFTLGSTRVFKSRPIRKSGEPRPLHNINAITGVKKMKGGKEHYLAKLEKGRTQRGNSKTRNRVPIPLQAGRTSQNINKPIAGANRLTKGDTQTLTAGGSPFGVPGDRNTRTGRSWKNPRQRFAALYRYQRSGGGTGNLSGDLKKPFFFIGNDDKLGIFKFIRGRARKIRSLEDTSVRTKKRPNFKDSVDDMRASDIQKKFIRKAERAIG